MQFEYALNERLSINAPKDGCIDFNPDNILSDTGGWANVAAGVKYAWLYRPDDKSASSVQLLFEISMGNTDVWQGEANGVFIPLISTLNLLSPWQFLNHLGFKLPVDGDAESTMFYTSAHVSYELDEWIKPLAALSWFHVILIREIAGRGLVHRLEGRSLVWLALRQVIL